MKRISESDALRVLQSGTMEIAGVLPWSSNYAFLVRVCADSIELPAVYKPQRGERPLWDFPPGTLSQRELATYLVSEQIGWHLVPPTVLRDGEYGKGSVQLYIEHDPDQHYFVVESDPIFRVPLQKMALFDYVINNADRKGGHVIIEQRQEDSTTDIPESLYVWGIDHGICFHTDYKLRTVIWEFAGDPIPPKMLSDLEAFAAFLQDPGSHVRTALAPLLTRGEIAALMKRTARLISDAVFPSPGPGRHYPWPPV